MKIGIFGAGHMGGAMIKGWVKSKTILPQDILVKGGKNSTAEKLQESIPFKLTYSMSDFKNVDIIYLAVGTPFIMNLLQDLTNQLDEQIIPIVSVSAGVSVQEMQTIVDDSYPIAQAIPNTPVQINEGLTGIIYAQKIESNAKRIIQGSLELLGELIEIADNQLGILGAVAGCGPALVDIFMESLADGAVLNGMNREMAYHVVAKMVASSANLLLETGKHPGELKDQVTSPGGTTIKGVTALEKEGFRFATINAIDTIMK